MGEEDESSTLVGLRSGISTASVWLRRGALVLLAAVVVAGLTSWLGVHTSEATATRNGYTLSVKYPRVAQPGLDVLFSIRLDHPGGFGKQVTLRLTNGYAQILEQQNIWPQPSDETRDASYDYLTFSPPPGDTFTVLFDTYIQPASQRGRSAEVAALDTQLQPIVAVDYHTTLMP